MKIDLRVLEFNWEFDGNVAIYPVNTFIRTQYDAIPRHEPKLCLLANHQLKLVHQKYIQPTTGVLLKLSI